MKISELCIEEYRAALAEGAAEALPQERELYALHERTLTQLVATAAKENSTKEDLLVLLRTEHRAFGWSYLSGQAGAYVEETFQKLLASIEALDSV